MIYIAITLPLEIAFLSRNHFTLTLDMLSILFQAFYILVILRTPVMVSGFYTLSFKHVLRNYFHNGLLIDLMGVLPLNVIFENYSYAYPTIILITLLRLTRMLAIKKLLESFEKFEIEFKKLNVFMFIIKTVLILYLLLHWTSSFWFFVNKYIEPNIYDKSWFTMLEL